MGKARNLADLLDDNGDVKSASLDNVPASNNASALTTGTLPIARIADDAITNAKLATGITASKLTGDLPAISGANLTGVGVAGISSSADATAMTITSAEKIGIGETAPLGQLHIKEQDSGVSSISSNGDQLVLENSGHCGMHILSGTSSDGILYFGDSGGSGMGQLKYQHGSNQFVFETNQ